MSPQTIRCLMVAALLAVAASAHAQPAQTGTISGTVLDTSGGVMPGVTLTATSQDRGFIRLAVTDRKSVV